MKFIRPSSPPSGFLKCIGFSPRCFRALLSARVSDDRILADFPPASSDPDSNSCCLYVRAEFSRAVSFSSVACSKAVNLSNSPVLSFLAIFCSTGQPMCRLHCRILHLPGTDEDEGGVFQNPSAPPCVPSDQLRAASQAAAKLDQLPSAGSHGRFWPRRTRWAADSMRKAFENGGTLFLITSVLKSIMSYVLIIHS